MFNRFNFWGIAFVLGSVGAAHAQSSTTFEVRITITESCNISTTADVHFGSHARSGTVGTVAGTLSVNCSAGTPYSIALNNGLFPTAGGIRRMTSGTNVVAYGLYKDLAGTQPWTPASPRSGTGTGGPDPVNVYASLEAGASNTPAGSYVDTVTAIVTY